MTTKPEIIDQLSAAGIEHDPSALKADLEVLLPVEPATPKQVTVCDPGGNPHRVFSLEIHGDAFADNAAEFVASRPGWTVK